ncbi:hypothetical protein [Lacticaseibacillus absianus]|uniref:hypothetical protein n=1 Tax=Lacticaseibacillus absianus TaxID=2729623 RepID=UPI0015C90680|nr:hypothetical protein [Lacticaseibacillus absianus]
MWWWLSILIVGLGVAGVLLWRAVHRRQALRGYIAQAQRITDSAVAGALRQLGWAASVASEPVADVWGHGILAFEYEVAEPADGTVTALNAALVAVATATGQQGVDPQTPAFVVTDYWRRDGQLHFDVAFVTNAVTAEYVADVARV